VARREEEKPVTEQDGKGRSLRRETGRSCTSVARKRAALDAWLDRLKILTAAPRAAEFKGKSQTLILERSQINRAD